MVPGARVCIDRDPSRRAAREAFTPVRALRALALCLLVLSTSGMVPVAGTCLEQVRGCGDVCKRCECKRRPASGSLRAPCACCSSQPGTQPLTLLGPAILADITDSVALSPDAHVGRDAVADVLTFAPPVPHPPPRTFPLA